MSLSFLDRIVEERILEAARNGEFDNLPGAGKPLSVDEEPVPEDLRIAYKILRNANCLPPEIELRRDILRLRDLIAAVNDTDELPALVARVNQDILRLNLARRSSPLTDVPQVYLRRPGPSSGDS